MNQLNHSLENSLFHWTFVIIVSLLIATGIKFIIRLLLPHIRRSGQKKLSATPKLVADLLGELKSISVFAWTFHFLAQMQSGQTYSFIKMIVVIVTAYQFGKWGFYLISKWRETYLLEIIGKDASSAAALGLLYAAIQVIFLTTVLLIGLSNLGVDIAALIAGLGVGGIAVALAAQNILGDLLASLSIVLDKPFLIGDNISVGGENGIVEQIGIKTTRLRGTTGEELIYSNKAILESRIHNFKRMPDRQMAHRISVVYTTKTEKLTMIPKWIEEIISRQRDLQFERCHLIKLGTVSLDFEIIFKSKTPDYKICMDLQEKVLIAILKKFEEEQIEFPIPAPPIILDRSALAKN